MFLFLIVSICSTLILAAPGKYRTGPASLGATYFITNKDQNTIIASSINANGTLSFGREIPTGGAGGSASGGADALFTQDSIIQVGGKVFAVNPGDNTVSMFTVNENDSTQLTMVGSPTNTMGEFPVAVAFSKKHNTACVVNSGGDSNLACFSVSKKGLAPLNDTVRTLGINQTNPPTGPANTVSDIIFNQDESALLVSVKGTPNGTVGFIANYGISGTHSFALYADPAISTPDKGVLPFSMTLVGECGDVLFNTDAAFGISVSKFDPQSGDIIESSSVAIDNQTATCWSSTSPRTGSFYVTDVGNAIVSEFSVDPTGPSAKLLAQHTLDGIGGRIDQAVASTHAGDFLYALGAKAGSVNVLKLTGPGKAQQIQTFVVTDAVPDLPISVQGMAVFVK